MADNVTRQTIPQDPLNPVDHLNSGYEDEASTEFTIPPCGIEDADTALRNLFFNDIGFTTKQNHGPNKNITIDKPLIIFATGERWALAKKLHPPRDKNKRLLLPAISIRRTGFEQTKDDTSGRGINQTTGNLVIKRRLSEDFDRNYQNLINKSALGSLTNLPTANDTSSSRKKNRNGGLLKPDLGNNVWEIITIPQPQFFTTTYEVVFWTQYTFHMNEMIEKFVTSYLPQNKMFKLQTDKGYWFMAYVEDAMQSADNFEDFKESERIIRYTITMKVKGFIVAADGATDKVPIRRWVSSPSLSFDVSSYPNEGTVADAALLEKQRFEDPTENNNFILSDTLSDPPTSQTKSTIGKLKVQKKLTSKPVTYEGVTILESNQKSGETVYKANSLQSLEDFLKR